MRALRQTLGHKARAVPDSAYTQAGEAPRSVKPLTEPVLARPRLPLTLVVPTTLTTLGLTVRCDAAWWL